jgi:hypothetical protein
MFRVKRRGGACFHPDILTVACGVWTSNHFISRPSKYRQPHQPTVLESFSKGHIPAGLHCYPCELEHCLPLDSLTMWLTQETAKNKVDYLSDFLRCRLFEAKCGCAFVCAIQPFQCPAAHADPDTISTEPPDHVGQ